jgi:dihydroflavonol-4-reductase
MPHLVTGGSGFVGAHVVRALLKRGESVRCLVRNTSPRTNLEGLDVELVVGDLRDHDSLRVAADGCDAVYHCAADYRLYAKNPQDLYDSNVEGTRALMAAARDAGVRRVVYTSSVGALGLRSDGVPADETVPVSVDKMIGHYKRSKFLAERVVEEAAADGLDVVIVNPSTPVGDLDVKPTPTGQMIVDFLNGKMPAYVDTGLNLVDVRDVAEGHVLAAEKGERGRKYILGNRNMSLIEIFESLSELTNLPAPKVRVPHWVPYLAAMASTGWAKLRDSEPGISLESVRMSRYRMYFDGSRAVRELGMPQTPVEEALLRAVDYFRATGQASQGS